MYKNKFISAIITAAGIGLRMSKEIPKLELELGGKPIIDLTVEKIYNTNVFDEIIVVTNAQLLDKYEKRFQKFDKLRVVLGGDSREESTYLGLKAINPNCEIVVCHDGARPFVGQETIINSIDSAIEFGSGVASVPVKDTIKMAKDGTVFSTLDRKFLYHIQTPQTFKFDVIKKAYDNYFGKISVTDDSGYLEALGEKVHLINGSYDNFKITTPEDLLMGKIILEEKWE